MSKSTLDLFGHLLMSQVRDEAISDWKMIINGSMKGEMAQNIGQRIKNLTDEQKKILLSLVPDIIDTTLHHLLWTLEQNKDLAFCVQFEDGKVENLKNISDGLAGELYSKNGWIARFSKESI